MGSDLDAKISATKSGCRFESPNPLVSVVIPSYNAERTIARAIQSVLEQDYESLEIIVADDGSTDSTPQVIGQFHDPRITLVGSPLNRGAAAARNTAIRRANGAYVAFLDADDIWLPGKISTQVRIMEQHPKARIATCDCRFFSIDGRPKGTFFQTRTPCAGENAWRILLAYNFIATPTVLARRTDVVELGGFSEKFPIAEDQDLWIKLATLGEVVFTHEILAYVYSQPASLSSRFQKHEASSILSMVGKHLHQQAYRLQNDEIRAIWGQRLFYVAANLYQNKEYGRSAPLFWQSVRCGFRPLKSLLGVGRAVGYGIFWRHGNLSVTVWREGASKATIPVRRWERPAMQKVSWGQTTVRSAAARAKNEADFHNSLYRGKLRKSASSFYELMDSSSRYYRQFLKMHCAGKTVLEYGCGENSVAPFLFKNGARSYVGIDISSTAIEQAERARRVGSDFAQWPEYYVMNAEALEFEDNSFDLICGIAILHHLDLESAYAEIARTLRPNGAAIFLEPLAYNPLINLYRRFTPHLRSPDEHPLVMADLKMAELNFRSVETRFYNLFTLLSLVCSGTSWLPALCRFLDRLDGGVFTCCPFFRRYAWSVSLVLTSPVKRVPSRVFVGSGGNPTDL